MKKIILLLALLFGLSSIAQAETVVYNTQTGKYHKVTCQHAKKCTKNCIKIDKKEAQIRQGVPCKVCGG